MRASERPFGIVIYGRRSLCTTLENRPRTVNSCVLAASAREDRRLMTFPIYANHSATGGASSRAVCGGLGHGASTHKLKSILPMWTDREGTVLVDVTVQLIAAAHLRFRASDSS